MDHDPVVVALGERLRTLGYDALHIGRRLARIPDRLTPANVALAEQRAGDDELGLAIRFWNLGQPLPVDLLEVMLGGVDREALRTAGLVTRADEEERASLRITSASGRLHCHDFDRGTRLSQGHVLGVGAATRTLAGITPHTRVERALDLGTGCGAQAFGLAEHADTVIATDLNERAAWTTRLGTALNGIERVEVRVGDALDPVADEEFDLVVCNPPFVISPADELTFRDGGVRGDALSRELVRAAAACLRPGGVACVLVNWVVPAGAAAVDVARAWVDDLPADVLLLHHDALDPVAYAERWMLLPGDASLETQRAELGRWLGELERLGAAKVAAGAFVIERTDRPLRLRVARMQKRPAEGGSQVRRMLDAMGRFTGADDPALRATVFRLVPGHRLEQRLHYGTSGYAPGAAALRLDRSAGVLTSIPAKLLEAVFLIDGHAALESIAIEVAAARGEAASEVSAELRPLVLDLFELGFLEVVEDETAA